MLLSQRLAAVRAWMFQGSVAGMVFWRQLGPLLVLLTTVVAPAVASPAPGGGPPEHAGFYFNTDVGAANCQYHFTGPRDTMDTYTQGVSLALRFGYALTRNVILSADLGASATMQNPNTTLDGFSVNSSGNLQFSSTLVGVGVAWYFEHNLLLGFTVGTGRITLNLDNRDLNSDNGFASQLRFGKEWWIGDYWGLGVIGGVTYVSANANMDISVTNPFGNTGTVYFNHTDSTTGFVAFTATFN